MKLAGHIPFNKVKSHAKFQGSSYMWKGDMTDWKTYILAVRTNNWNCHFSKFITLKLLIIQSSYLVDTVSILQWSSLYFFSSNKKEVKGKYDASKMAFCVICVMEIPQKCQNLTFVEITVFHLFCHLWIMYRQNKAQKGLKWTAMTYPVT